MTRKVYLDSGARIQGFHSLFEEFKLYPPEGYEFVVDKAVSGIDSYTVTRKLGARALHRIRLLPYIQRFLWQYRWYTGDFSRRTQNADLTLSAFRLNLKRKPWVMLVDYMGDFCPVTYDTEHLRFYKSLIEKVLSSEYCKKIIPYSYYIKGRIFASLNCERFRDKIETVHLGVHPKNFTKKYEKDRITLLFLGTVNTANILRSFNERGGKEVLETFAILNEKYDNLELIIRTYVPTDIRKKYSRMLKSPNVKIFDRVLPKEQFEQIMKESDILLFPSYHTPAMTILDAMSYEMPVIATNLEGIPEMVKDGETGFLIKKHRKPFYSIDADFDVVDDLVDKASILIEDSTLRRKMGLAGRKEIETGEFSIKKRNEKLKRIFDEAIEN